MARNFLLLILLTHTLFGSDVFWFSYKIVTVNGVAIYEERNITPLMLPSVGENIFLCSVDLTGYDKTSKHLFLKKNFDKILPCFYTLKSHLTSWNENRLQGGFDRIELIIEPTRFTVDFKDEFATISTIR